MKRPKERHFLLAGNVSKKTDQEIRKVLEASGKGYYFSEMPFDYSVSRDDIVEALEDVYEGNEDDISDVVDIDAIADMLGDTDSEAWMQYEDATDQLVQDALIRWVKSSGHTEIEDDFPDLDFD